MPTRTAIVLPSSASAGVDRPPLFVDGPGHQRECANPSSVMLTSYFVGTAEPIGPKVPGPLRIRCGTGSPGSARGSRKTNGPRRRRRGPLLGSKDSASAADLEDLPAALRACALERRLAVLHRDPLRVLDFDLHLVLHAVGFGHG